MSEAHEPVGADEAHGQGQYSLELSDPAVCLEHLADCLQSAHLAIVADAASKTDTKVPMSVLCLCYQAMFASRGPYATYLSETSAECAQLFLMDRAIVPCSLQIWSNCSLHA
jgi:hypothetical protein